MCKLVNSGFYKNPFSLSQLRNNKDVIRRHTTFINYSNQKQLHISAKYSSRHQAVFVRQRKDNFMFC
jgi:hypothetical protein